MNNEFTAVIKKEGDWWIGWIEEVPGVNCQERSREALLESLKVTLKEALEFNRQDALSAVGEGFVEEKSRYRKTRSYGIHSRASLRTVDTCFGMAGREERG